MGLAAAPSNVRKRRLALAAIAMLLVCASSAAAQMLSIGGLDGQLGFGTTFENQDISQQQQHTRQHLDRLYFEERLGVRTRGYFYDPDLVRFALGVELGLFQDHLNNDTNGVPTSLSGDGLLTGYDAEMDVLGAKPYGFQVFGHRGEGFTRRDFAGQVKTDLNRYGVNWRLQDLPLPSYITVEEQDTKQSFTLSPAGVQQDERRRIASYYGERRDDTQTLTVDYRFDDVTDRVLPQGAFQVHSGGVSHLWRFSDFPEENLSSDVRAYQREGEVSGTTLFEREGLHLRHSRDLSSDYNYTFSLFQEPGTGTTTSHNGFAGIQHQFYKSLVSSANVNAGYTDLSPGQDTTYGGGLGFGYTKQIIGGAIFTAGIAAAYQLDDRVVPSGQLPVSNEQHTFCPQFNGSPCQEVTSFSLVNFDVIEPTIVVTDATGGVLYHAQFDYFVDHPSPRRTEIRRNPLGTIPSTGTVLVSYSFTVSGALKVGSRPINFNVGLDYDWLSLFYSGQRLRQDVFAGTASDVLGPIDTDTAGFALHWHSELADARLLQEYLTYDSKDLTYRAFTFTQSALDSPRRWVTLGLSSTESTYDFSIPHRNRTFVSTRGNVGWRPLSGLTIDTFAGFHYQRETTVPLNQLAEYGTHARWVAGLFTLSLGYDHANQDIGGFSRAGDLVRFDVIRRLK
jgi:hypothetical protein